MMCDNCKERDAVINLTQVEHDTKVTLHLCEQCAQQKGVETGASVLKTPLGGFLQGMIGKGGNVLPTPADGLRCAACGSTLKDFRESGRLGCSQCYDSFAPHLRDLLRRLHGSSQHVGERYAPPGADGATDPRLQLLELKEQLRRAVDKGRFGRIFLANTTVRWQRPQEYYDAAPWRGTWEFDGGAIMNQASHYVDLIQWLVGPVESVLAKTATQARRIEAEDSGVALLKFRSGALGVIEVNVLTYPRNLEGSITILGEKGSVKIGGTAVNRVEHWLFADYDDDDKLIDSANTNPPNVYGFGHEGYYRNVLSVLRGEAQPQTDGRAGRKSLEVILGIYESAKVGREVPIPLRGVV